MIFIIQIECYFKWIGVDFHIYIVYISFLYIYTIKEKFNAYTKWRKNVISNLKKKRNLDIF